ncbi:TetR/AcrR family transcriptional regulator [Actinophytocola sp.]|uniref:TetR/AcrR family transcriptional regulator n=1 Tax=Actinophytocola sp. TaxID=1872138 RepID=UPI003D6A6C9A
MARYRDQVGLSRAQTQERNRAKVLAAAREEFAERGFRDAKIDSIAARAGLTRGAVYSNFPGKRALYFAVLAEVEWPAPPNPTLGRSPAEALGALARAWVARLDGPEARLGVDLFGEVQADESVRTPFTRLMILDALLLGLALERLRPPAPGARLVRLAETALTMLHGARRLAAAAPGFGEAFDVVSACERLAGLELNDYWAPPRLAPPTRPASEPWSPPPAVDLVTGSPARLDGGVVAVLGPHRLPAVEEAVRAGAGSPVTVVLVTGAPAELDPLARLVIGELCGCLRQSFPRTAWPPVQVVCDPAGSVAAAAGVPAVSDGTEAAVRVEDGRIVSRADGFGACHAVAAEHDSKHSGSAAPGHAAGLF